jgi:bifunctional UDP-N-acetylglucosamine pyrophosphorylase / glucosamine-1-phosphate N-acetyltransferase
MNIVVLAAGMGKRMKSDLPKVLHTIAGKPLLAHVLDCARSLSPKRLIVIYGHGGEQVQEQMANKDLHWAKQEPQLGTGHAVQQAVPQLDDSVPTLILSGDVPLIKKASLDKLLEAAGTDKLGVLTVNLPNPHGYGRMVRKTARSSPSLKKKMPMRKLSKLTKLTPAFWFAQPEHLSAG